MFRASVGVASLVTVFALTRPVGTYDFGTWVEAVAMALRMRGQGASRRNPSKES